MVNKMKKQFRLPGSVLAKIRNPTEQNNSEPTTAEDFYTQGITSDESGDRWFSSDLSKSLRFYYRAHNYYKEALKLKPDLGDALFNLPRLEYDVYSKYIKDDSVVLEDLENCAEALNDNGEDGLFQNVESLCKRFENCISVMQQANEGDIGWDFKFNVAMCYFEYIDVLCSDAFIVQNIPSNNNLVMAIQRCIELFSNVLDYTVGATVGTINDVTVNLETVAGVCVESYRMVTAIYETLYTEDLIRFIDTITNQYLQKVDEVANSFTIDVIPMDVLVPIKIAKLHERAARELNFDSFINIWNSETDLNNILDKQLVETSSIRSFIDKFETVDMQLPHENKWRILSLLNGKYKIITETLRNEIKALESINSTEGELLSGKISLLCSVFIERADIDLERSLLDCEESFQHKTTLQKNCVNLLKNALIFSKKSGGIKEGANEKLTRKKRQREAAMRLCLIEGKSQQEWNTIIGEKYWPSELQAISEVDAYKAYFTQSTV